MPEHQGQTSQVKKVKLESSIQQVYWTRRAAAPGGTVGLEVFTHYVGNNSEIKIELTDKSGESHGNFTDKIHGNHFWGPVNVPVNAKDQLIAEVKLSKHSLSQKSGPLVILPPVQITNMKWDKNEARRGDILKLTADVKGVPDGVEAMVEIWEHDADGAHDFVTKFPVQVKNKKVEAEWEYQYLDDTDDIPTHEEAERGYSNPEYFWRVSLYGRQFSEEQDCELLKFLDHLEVHVVDVQGKPVAGREVDAHFADGTSQTVRTDGDGIAHFESAAPGPVDVEFGDWPEEEEGE